MPCRLIVCPYHPRIRRVYFAEIDAVPACDARFLWRIIPKRMGEELFERFMMGCGSGDFMGWIKV
jgi:hypothetical protein